MVSPIKTGVRQPNLLPAEIGHGVLADVGGAHAGDQRQSEGAVDQNPSPAGLAGVLAVEVQGVGVQRDMAEEGVVQLRDRPAMGIAVDVPDLEVFEIAPLPTLLGGALGIGHRVSQLSRDGGRPGRAGANRGALPLLPAYCSAYPDWRQCKIFSPARMQRAAGALPQRPAACRPAILCSKISLFQADLSRERPHADPAQPPTHRQKRGGGCRRPGDRHAPAGCRSRSGDPASAAATPPMPPWRLLSPWGWWSPS